VWRCEQSGFVAAALRELSVGLCKGNYLMDWASLGGSAGVSRRASAREFGLCRMCD
jgi:hypothetical protein